VTWIFFDEADHYSPAPHFCLPSFKGQVCLRDYYEDCNQVLVFTQGFGEENRAGLDEFSARLDEYMTSEAKILAVLTDSLDASEAVEPSQNLPFPLLFDEKKTVRTAYAGLMDVSLVNDEDSMIFVLDRYSAPYAAWIGKDFSDPTIHKEVQNWLAYIGIQCPE
jgi:peroxiredoxin